MAISNVFIISCWIAYLGPGFKMYTCRIRVPPLTYRRVPSSHKTGRVVRTQYNPQVEFAIFLPNLLDLSEP